MQWLYILIGACFISGLLLLPRSYYEIFLILVLTVAILVALSETKKRE